MVAACSDIAMQQDGVWANKLMASVETPQQKVNSWLLQKRVLTYSQICAFTDVFDGQEVFDTSDRKYYSPSDLRPGDIAIVELFLTRYKPRARQDKTVPVSQAAFELKSVILLQKGPPREAEVNDVERIVL